MSNERMCVGKGLRRWWERRRWRAERARVHDWGMGGDEGKGVERMKILVINCGSSSLKYQVIDMDTNNPIAKGLVERIGLPGAVLTHKLASG